jgi:hypothetical protein
MENSNEEETKSMKKLMKKVICTSITAALMFAAVNASAADAPAPESLHDAEAEALLKKMSDYIGGLKSLSVDVYVFDEQIMDDGFKLSVLQSGTVKIRLPDKLYVSRKGVVRDQESFFDGKNLVVYGKNIGQFIEVPVEGNVDDALDAATNIFGAELPGRDIFSQDAYSPLMEVITESSSLGSIQIGDTTCRQLAFRTNEVDYQLWISEGNQPLPCRYTITSKWTFGAPQYTVTFTDWKVNQNIQDSDFTFNTPEGTQKTTVDAFKNALAQEVNKL